MLWVLWDIVLPLIATFLIGLFTGWLLWRWRRSRIDADGLSKLRRSSARNKADVERLQQSNNDLSERLRAAGGGNELKMARRQIDELTGELKSSRREVAELKHSAGGDNLVDSNLQAELQLAHSRIAELEATNVQGAAGMYEDSSTADLRHELASRDRMIATLEKSLQQFGESGDTTALMADIAIRDRKIDELEAVIATFNRG